MENWMSRIDAEGFAKRLRDARKASGISQLLFAKNMGVSINTVSYWENARTQPMPEKIKKIALELGTTEEFLRAGVQSNGTSQFGEHKSADITTIVEEARRRIASAQGVRPSQVRITIDLTPNETH